MARTKQTARKSTGGKAPRKTIISHVMQKKVQKLQAQNPTIKIDEAAPQVITYDVTYETSFYAHYFGTGITKDNFEPRVTLAKSYNRSIDRTSDTQLENWVSVAFNSKYNGQGIVQHGRPKLNLVIALDVSGSMSSPFQGENNKSKLDVAKESIITLLCQLQQDDSLGLMIFDDKTHLIHPMTRWGDIDRPALERSINNLRIGGGTYIAPAVKMATDMFKDAKESSSLSNRIIFLTDMEVCTDDGTEFENFVVKNSANSIYATIVGVGLDLSGAVIERVSKTNGCNYCNVRTSQNFWEIMNKEFGYLVTPVAFNVNIELKSKQLSLVKGFGSPEVRNVKSGQKNIKLSTEFPSAQNDKAETRGGMILFKLNGDADKKQKHELTFEWEDDMGITHKASKVLDFSVGAEGEEYYETTAIRKAIALINYTDFVQGYIGMRTAEDTKANQEKFSKYRKSFAGQIQRLVSEGQTVQDPTLIQECKILLELAKEDQITLDDKLADVEVLKFQLKNAVEDKQQDQAPVAGAAVPANQNNDAPVHASRNNNKRKAGDADLDDDEKVAKKAKPNNNNNNDGAANKRVTRSQAKVVQNENNSTKKTPAKKGRGKKSKAAKDTEADLCCVCMDEKRCVMFEPCNHMCTCQNCCALEECPLCRAAVSSTTRVYV